jgi:twitching motility two-component system response regulator PilH
MHVSAKKILVVDDSPTDLRLVSGPLAQKGYHVITASDGEEALEKANREQPDLVVIDVILPKKNGFQVCRQLKTSPETRAIKVMLLTSKDQDSDRFWGLKQGADNYMTKPFEDEALLSNVAQLL